MIFTQKQEEARRYDRNLVVEANAGSGKTAVLVERFVNIILNIHDIKINNIVGITFTEKAANELKNRIFLRLSELLETGSNIDQNKAKLLLERISSLRIGTIHSFCSNILRDFPNEAEIDPNFSILEGIDQIAMLESAMDEILRGILEEKHTLDIKSDLENLLKMYGTKKVKKILNSLIENREKVFLLKKYFYSKTNEEIISFWLSDIEHFTRKILSFTALPESLKDFDQLLDQDINELIARYFVGQSINEKSFLTSEIYNLIYTQQGEIRKKFLKKIDNDPYLMECLVEINKKFSRIGLLFSFIEYYKQNTIDVSDLKFQLEITRKYINVFDKIIEKYKHHKDLNSQLDFDDLLWKVKEILQIENVRKELNEKILFLMVDEYQDTNHLQFEIIDTLLEHLHKGNLFIVGDPKQSIYGFRNAEVEIFNRTAALISDIDRNKQNGMSTQNELVFSTTENKDSRIILDESFRLLSDLVAFINYLFEKVMIKDEFEDIQYKPLIKARNNNEKGEVELLLCPSDTEDEYYQEEMIARKIQSFVSTAKIIFETKNENPRKIEFGDIAVLLRSRTNLKKLEDTFTKYKIPYIVSSGIGYYQTQEIYDLYNYLKFLLNSKDDIALVGILRSPFFAIPDSELYKISLLKKYDHPFWEKVQYYVDDHPESIELKYAYSTLSEDLLIAKRLSIPDLINRLTTQTGWYGVISGSERGEQTFANLNKFLNIAREFEGKGFNTLFDFMERLKVLVTDEEKEGQAVIDPSNQMVKIMTIHASKGLEFPVVFIPYLDRSFRGEFEPFIHNLYGIGFEIPDENDYEIEKVKTISTLFLQSLQKIKNSSEEKRVLYVAMTRAHNHLVLSGKFNPKQNRNNYLSWIRDVFDLDEKLIVKSEIESENNQKEKHGIISSIENYKTPLMISKIIDNKYCYEEITDYSFDIRITTCLEEIELIDSTVETETNKEIFANIKIDIDPIKSIIKGNYISSTLFQTFIECPTKYYLKYSLGFPQEILNSANPKNYSKKHNSDITKPTSKIFLNSIEENEYDYPKNDPEIFLENDSPYILPGTIRGKILHKLMESIDLFQKDRGFISEYVKNILESFYLNSDVNSDEDIIYFSRIVEKFLLSKSWSFLKNYNNYFCEYELQAVFDNDYLVGIIDRLCYDENTCILIDYKTEKLQLENINERVKSYSNQLLFYSYLVKKFNPDKIVRPYVVFLEYPNFPQQIKYSEEDFLEFENVLKRVINETKIIENPQYKLLKNPDHCKFCEYFINKKCIL